MKEKMKEIEIDLTDLVKPPFTYSIYGRDLGEIYALEKNLSDHVKNGDKIIIKIDSEKVKAINDSFIKGFFCKIFEMLYTVSEVRKYFELKMCDEFKNLFEKNWIILESLNK